MTLAKISGQRFKTKLGQSLQYRNAARKLVTTLGISAKPLAQFRQFGNRHCLKITVSRRKHGRQMLKIFRNILGQFHSLCQIRRQCRPAIRIAMLAPHITSFLNGQQSTVKIIDVGTRAEHILRLFDQTDSLRTRHGNTVFLTPLLRSGRNHHIGCRALEDAGLEDIQNLTNALEHRQLCIPLTHISSGGDPTFSRNRGHDDSQLRKRFLCQTIDSLKNIGNLLLGANDDPLPGTNLRLARENSKGRGLVKKLAGTLPLVGSDLKKNILAKAYTSSGSGLCCR